jgi:hypothetical protein
MEAFVHATLLAGTETSNIQPRTSNAEVSPAISQAGSMFDVRCSMFDVFVKLPKTLCVQLQLHM